MHLDRLATLSLARPLLRSGILNAKAGIPILMYHSISSGGEAETSPYYRVTTTPERFRQHLRWMHEAGYKAVGLPEALESLGSARKGTGRAVVLTFDDGFQDFLTEAWPALEEWGYTATVFLPTAFIHNERKMFKGRPCLTWREVRELKSRGIVFGSHTENHPKLHELEWHEIRQELSRSKATLEAELQSPVRLFSYPYAFPQEDRPFTTRLRSEMAELGYETAVTTMIGRASGGCDALALKRLPINECDDEPLLMAKLAGAYDWMARAQLAFRKTTQWSRVPRSA
jgi:peptidoglycan/xylan/chitin deacetylase (PgdA/CDA1 family)